jgi:SAM-dependent methyltransferase
MGIGIHSARSLIDVRRRGVSFMRTLTLGRQDLAVPYPVIAGLFRSLECPTATAPTLSPDDSCWSHAEPFFELLGAGQVEALDASPFEGANLIHDLNRPVPEELWGRFDVVFDGGTLEHVFQLPTAIQSCMRMVKIGGRLILHTPGNNWFGHGFYQFSPELFFHVLSEANGFALERMTVVENFPAGRCYAMADPARSGLYVETYSVLPILIMVEAVKQHEVPHLLALPPQQSYYADQWGSVSAPGSRLSRRVVGRRKAVGSRRLSGRIADLLYWWAVMREVRKSRRRGFEWQGSFYTRIGE